MMTLLKNAMVYKPERIGIKHVLIAGSKIIGLTDDIPQLDTRLDVEILDLDGAIVAPGIIDGHTHITGGGGESGYASRVPPVNLSRYSSAGITTVVGVLGTDDVTRNTQSLVAQANALCAEGLTAYCYTGGYHIPLTTLTGSIREDIAYIDRIIGVGELAISDHRSSQPQLSEILRIASDAHVAGLMTGKAGIVHFHLGDGPRGLALLNQALDETELPARVFNPSHINRNKRLFDEAVNLATRGCFVDLTAFPDSGPDEWSAAEGLLRYLASGSPVDQITISSDGGGCLPTFDQHGQITHSQVGDPLTLQQTLNQLISDTNPLEKILPAFTRNVAKLLRLHQKGVLEVGRDADLMVLDTEGQLWGTMALGRWHFKEKQCLIKGQFES